MMERGHDWYALQCRVKVKELRNVYRKAREANRCSDAAPVTCRFYKELDVILGGNPTSTQEYHNGHSRAQFYKSAQCHVGIRSGRLILMNLSAVFEAVNEKILPSLRLVCTTKLGRFYRSQFLETDFIQLIVYVHTKRIKSAECILTTVASIDLQKGALWVAIPQSPLPIGILG
ncbi:hypothetical protein UY3_05997 [Chelonia mydas]|uniref:Uncharacterized protein n=1 Tax=Chelonia mydas TaxID=8469 RepID=M7BG12_CHEMY|nr:hypothetical protein UY3_05997 [Chelonia mydas]